MKRKKQEYLPGFQSLGLKQFGGGLLKGNPREARPVSVKRPMHLVMRSTKAKGELSFLRTVRGKKIETTVKSLGQKMGVKVYRFANAGNHLHLIVLPRSREAFRAYLRAVTGLIARITLGAERGNARNEKFWDARPYTRILEWGNDFRMTCRYLMQNTLEALGFLPYQPRKHKSKLLASTA